VMDSLIKGLYILTMNFLRINKALAIIKQLWIIKLNLIILDFYPIEIHLE
jgi:hypothetical protein